MVRVIVFDLGGTLMEYIGMPHSWISYYKDCFEAVNDRYSLHLSKSAIEQSIEILKEYNPRYKPRELEYTAEFLFGEATKHWHSKLPIDDIIIAFFDGMKLSAKIYSDTMPTITKLKKEGYQIAALTNLPSAMPDRLFCADIPEILDVLDLYVSSELCGYRKPNKAGLEYIARHFGVNVTDLIFVGDEKLDIDTAKNAGCKSVLIDRNNRQEQYGQDDTIQSLADILHMKV